MAAYQRRPFEHYAQTIRDMRESTPGLFTETYLQDFTDRLIVTFERENAAFDRQRFLRACSDPRAKGKD